MPRISTFSMGRLRHIPREHGHLVIGDRFAGENIARTEPDRGNRRSEREETPGNCSVRCPDEVPRQPTCGSMTNPWMPSQPLATGDETDCDGNRSCRDTPPE